MKNVSKVKVGIIVQQINWYNADVSDEELLNYIKENGGEPLNENNIDDYLSCVGKEKYFSGDCDFYETEDIDNDEFYNCEIYYKTDLLNIKKMRAEKIKNLSAVRKEELI